MTEQNALQTEAEELQEDETVEGTGEETGAELATATGENQDKSEGGELTEQQKQERVQQAINRQHKKFRDEERKRLAAEERERKLQERLNELEAGRSEITVPPLPDPYDDEYERKIAERDDAIRQKAAQEAEAARLKEQQEANKQAAQTDELTRFNEMVATYDKRATELGLNSAEMVEAGTTVAEYGVSQDIVEYVLGHENGPLITKYLATNPLVLDDLRHLPPMKAAIQLETVIAPAAEALKPNKASGAPPPPDTVGGRGTVGDQVSPFIKGAKFE